MAGEFLIIKDEPAFKGCIWTYLDSFPGKAAGGDQFIATTAALLLIYSHLDAFFFSPLHLQR